MWSLLLAVDPHALTQLTDYDILLSMIPCPDINLFVLDYMTHDQQIFVLNCIVTSFVDRTQLISKLLNDYSFTVEELSDVDESTVGYAKSFFGDTHLQQNILHFKKCVHFKKKNKMKIH